MSYSLHPELDPFLDALSLHAPLDAADRSAFRRLPFRPSAIGPGEHVIRHDSKASYCHLILEGQAFSHKIMPSGGRQIMAFHLAGDIVGLEQAMLGHADHGVRAMTTVRTVAIAGHALAELMSTRPNVALAMLCRTLIDTATTREWLLNAARRPAKARIAHLLCELAYRHAPKGSVDGQAIDCRLTQEQMGDALGLTAVHVNRLVQALRADDLIRVDQRRITIVDWAALQQMGGFRPSYLHTRRVEEISDRFAPPAARQVA